MAYGEIAGYVASALVFATFYVRTMMPLRVLAITSNLAFIFYATMQGLTPILLLHTALLPVNIMRLLEIRRLIEITRSTPANEAPIEAIIPFMKQKKMRKGEYLFHKGDYSKHMYYLLSGNLRLVEIETTVGEGSVIGEIGLFSPSRERTASAVAETDCLLLSITDTALYQAYYQNPRLGFYLITLIARRFAETRNGLKERSSNQ